ncbi:MAG: DUF4340 domain-containing protein [Acidobacteriota bacterium]|nr:DUF4340 domain-containing protein [Acidobacteriota bacterium]
MRRLWSTLTLVAVCLGLAAYVYFVQSKQPPKGQQPKVFSVEAAAIDQLTVKGSAGQTATLRKVDGKWRLLQPEAAPADEAQVSGIVTALSSLSIARVIDEHASDLKSFGLASPAIELAFSTNDGRTEQRLLIGDKNATGIDMYAKLPGSPRVFLIPSYLRETFDLTPFDLRDKTLLRFDRDKLTGLDLTADGRTVDLSKSGTQWTIDQPLHAPGDFLTAENLVGRLQTAMMKSIVTEHPTDVKTYGLDKPQVTATLLVGADRTTLELGSKAPDGNVYARTSASPRIVTVEASLLDDLKKGPDDFRRKDLFTFRDYNADTVTLTRDGKTVTFSQQKGTGKDAAETWHRDTPAGTVKDGDMDDFLSKLSGLRAASWVASTAHTGLDKPYLTVTATFEDGKKHETVKFGREGSDVYASRADQPGAAKVDAKTFNDAMKAFDAVSR